MATTDLKLESCGSLMPPGPVGRLARSLPLINGKQAGALDRVFYRLAVSALRVASLITVICG